MVVNIYHSILVRLKTCTPASLRLPLPDFTITRRVKSVKGMSSINFSILMRMNWLGTQVVASYDVEGDMDQARR